ncbi:MAG TPA: hypothetical protein VGK45_14270, partial [Thermoanaerobaculia bacterium]
MRSPSSAPRSRGSRGSFTWTLVQAAPLLAVCLGLLQVFDLAHHPVLTLSLLGLAFLWLPAAARRLEPAASQSAILLSALVLRLALVPLPLTLSDDALRYLWDGRVTMAGFDPYTLP